MGTDGGAPPPAPECCMCGDYGLPEELFKCENCLFRYQHRYCSDMYPKADTCRFCNWCLKEDEGKAMKEAVSSTSSNSSNTKTTISSGATVKLQRGEFPASLSNPVKKPERSAQAKAASSRRPRSDDMPKGQKTGPILRSGKVRRYKLLEEVSS